MPIYPSQKYRELDEKAIQIRIDYGFLSETIDVFALAKKMGMVLIPYSSLKRGQFELLRKHSSILADGFSVMRNVDGRLVCYTFYNDAKSLDRQRFTIAHEIKHFVCRESDPNEEQEDLANHFARYLMAPTFLVMKYSDSTVSEVASHFNISKPAAINALSAAKNRSLSGCKRLCAFERRFMEEREKSNNEK